ncbi:DUF397 domain-containing protein [Streptomyces sp. NPDC003077]|uniref:DUF397 domain-containing protein n=1 Tax=Streptomyces sp. NPDC003077 TaxID=3154443 RepID=UPI0033BE52BE
MNITDVKWRKSSYSGTAGDNCVEVAVTEPTIHLRDSKDTTRPHITIGRHGWPPSSRTRRTAEPRGVLTHG